MQYVVLSWHGSVKSSWMVEVAPPSWNWMRTTRKATRDGSLHLDQSCGYSDSLVRLLDRGDILCKTRVPAGEVSRCSDPMFHIRDGSEGVLWDNRGTDYRFGADSQTVIQSREELHMQIDCMPCPTTEHSRCARTVSLNQATWELALRLAGKQLTKGLCETEREKEKNE